MLNRNLYVVFTNSGANSSGTNGNSNFHLEISVPPTKELLTLLLPNNNCGATRLANEPCRWRDLK